MALNSGQTSLTAAVVLAIAIAPLAARAGDDAGDYTPVMRQELARLGIEARCDEKLSTCFFEHSFDDGAKPVEVTVHYSESTNTIYIFIERFLVLEGSGGPSLELAQKLLELNRQMVTAKLEWDRTSGTIRISTVLNTDSNFDRKAFRSQLKGLMSNAEALKPILAELAAD